MVAELYVLSKLIMDNIFRSFVLLAMRTMYKKFGTPPQDIAHQLYDGTTTAAPGRNLLVHMTVAEKDFDFTDFMDYPEDDFSTDVVRHILKSWKPERKWDGVLPTHTLRWKYGARKKKRCIDSDEEVY